MPIAEPRKSRRALTLSTAVSFAAVLSDPAVAESEQSCVDRLMLLAAPEQLSCLRSDTSDNVTLPALAETLRFFDGTTDHRVVAAVLHSIRAHGTAARDVADSVAELLPHNAVIHQGRDKWQVLRLRAYVFATLSDIGVPDSAVPMLADALVYVDERMKAVEVGAAVRAAGTLGRDGQIFVPHLLAAIGERFAEEELSLDRYELAYPRAEATTVQLEAVDALGAIAQPDDSDALLVLHSIAGASTGSSLDSRLIERASLALASIEQRRQSTSEADPSTAIHHSVGTAHSAAHAHTEGHAHSAGTGSVTPWSAAADRQALAHLDIEIQDHDGRRQALSRLVDRPVFLTFFYTRCENADKCSTTVSRLALLQAELAAAGIAEKVRVLALTLEPDYDTPVRIKRYASDRGMTLGIGALVGRLETAGHASLLRELAAPVSYNGGRVNVHGVESVLLDGHGRVARKYTMHGWDQLPEDFAALLAGR